jgi:hypothetical protein
MSSWVHFTGGFGLDGIITGEKTWPSPSIGNTIVQLMSPLPKGSNGPANYKIKLNDVGHIHFADVLVTGDLRDLDSLDEIEEWLLRITKKINENGWDIRCGCFYAYVENRAPKIYYYNDIYYDISINSEWKKIDEVNGTPLHV